jgi:hypothetical protein
MHWSGKLFAVLVALAGLASGYFTAQLITVRNSWARKAATFETQYADTQAKLTETRRQAAQLRDELEAAVREWGGLAGAWNGVNTTLTSPDGKLAVDLGTNQRIKESQVLHGFELTPDGQAVYRGAFVVTTAQPDRSALSPMWRVRPDDVGTWQQQGRWRWRSLIPSAYTDRADDQALKFAELDETLNDRAGTLRIQNQLIAEADKQRKERIAELVGGAELAQDASLSEEFRQGLVPTLASVEEERNQLLLEIRTLREQVRAARDNLERLQQENEALVQKLPQPRPQVTRRD